MPTYEQELITVTRTIERLRTQARKLRRQLKRNKQDMAVERRHQKALLQSLAVVREPDIMPSRLTHGATGYRRLKGVVNE